MAGTIMSVAVILEFRFYMFAYFHATRTARMEFTTFRRMCRTGYIAVQYYTVAFMVRIGHGDRRKQCVCIRMHRLVEYAFFVAQLDKASQIHNADSVRNMLYYT